MDSTFFALENKNNFHYNRFKTKRNQRLPERMFIMRILVDKRELEKKLEQAKKGNLIEFCIVPSQMDSGRFHPAFLHIGTVHMDGTYEDLESVSEYRRLHLFQAIQK